MLSCEKYYEQIEGLKEWAGELVEDWEKLGFSFDEMQDAYVFTSKDNSFSIDLKSNAEAIMKKGNAVIEFNDLGLNLCFELINSVRGGV